MRSIRDCNAVVVGGAGFLGSHLVNHLIEDRNCRVLVVDNLCAGRSEFIHKDARFEHHDITGSEEHLRATFFNWKAAAVDRPLFVFNYAAHPYVPDSFARPVHVFNVNAFGALKVINAAQEAGAEGILQVSSAEVYGNHPNDKLINVGETASCYYKIKEDAPVKPHSSYGASKAAIDALCQVRWREARTPVIALRQFNCVGERETHPYVVPEIISQLAAQQDWDGKNWVADESLGERHSVKLGNNSFRDFLYAGDAVRIAVELLERGSFGEVYNLGSESGIKVYDLAKLIGRVMGFADVRVEVDEARKRPWEIWHLQSDNTKLYCALGKRDDVLTVEASQRVPLEEVLRRTDRWYEEQGRRWPWEH